MSLALALLLSATAAQTGADTDGVAVGKRLVAAIKGKAEFADADFSKKLGEQDKAALRQFGNCRVRGVSQGLLRSAERPDVFIEDPNLIYIRLGCKGVPSDTPVGITLHMEAGKVKKVETHNADLMEAR